jgi:hypothetical protein
MLCVYFDTHMVVIPSEYIQIIAAGIYAIALFYTIVTFRRSKRIDQVTLANPIFFELRELDRELAKISPESQYEGVRNQTYIRIFNTVNYLSFLVNVKLIDDRRLIEHMKPVIIKYYEEMFLRHVSADEGNSSSYQEFKKLSHTQEVKCAVVICP